jgi:hypothetical protein
MFLRSRGHQPRGYDPAQRGFVFDVSARELLPEYRAFTAELNVLSGGAR